MCPSRYKVGQEEGREQQKGQYQQSLPAKDVAAQRASWRMLLGSFAATYIIKYAWTGCRDPCPIVATISTGGNDRHGNREKAHLLVEDLRRFWEVDWHGIDLNAVLG